MKHSVPLRLHIACFACFAFATVLVVAALYCLLWVVSSSSMAFTECNGHYELFSSNVRCRQPPLAALLALVFALLAPLLIYVGWRLGRQASHNVA
jgi:hypothetical protein